MNIDNKREQLGQFFTNENEVKFCLSKLKFKQDLIIEPSFGSGNFLKHLPKNKKIGIELDEEYFNSFNFKNKLNINFYDYEIEEYNIKSIHFIGNPPYKTPAYSLSIPKYKKYVNQLCKKYNIKGIREESVFFILKSFDLMIENNLKGEISYILPKSIFDIHSKNFDTFKKFILDNFQIKQIYDIDPKKGFTNVSTKLIFINMVKKENKNYKITYNDKIIKIKDFFTSPYDEIIPFTKIFKKTFLGSVPCESIFMSCKNETINQFQNRLIKIFENKNLKKSQFLKLLEFEGKPHLQKLQKKDSVAEKTIYSYYKEIIESNNYNEILNSIKNLQNYKTIHHRKEVRFYLQEPLLKKFSFRYILNPNPQKGSFYFTGNPSISSTDYFGKKCYDVNRNSSPGACRTVPMNDIEKNLTKNFKSYWRKNTNKPFEKIFDYIINFSKSSEYKDLKKKYHRIHFGILKKFNNKWF